MSLFYRRATQRMLEECSSILTERQLQDFVARLNRENEGSLHVQWEIALLYAVSRENIAECEPDLGRRPDIRWTSRCSGNSFIADVRTISDEGLEKSNPRWFYRNELAKQVKKEGFSEGHFSDRPAHEMIGRHGNQKVRLKYPPKNESHRLFNKDFHEFLDWIKKDNPEHAERRLKGADFDVTIYYQKNVNAIPAGGGNISYTVYYSEENNPIFNALKSKALQLKNAKFEGVRGIILSDGGCNQLTSQMQDPANRTYNDHHVIQNFLGKNSSISFVMTIFARREHGDIFIPFCPLKIHGKIFVNPQAKHPVTDEIKNALERSLQYIPQPKLDGWNAANHLRNGLDGPQKGWYAGAKMETNAHAGSYKIKISSRALLELLAGRMSLQTFMREHNINFGHDNFYDAMLSGGHTIQKSSLEHLEDQDDDLIEFVFTPDFSAKAFEVPQSKTE